MLGKILTVVFVFLVILALPQQVQAKRLLPQAAGPKSSQASSPRITTRGVNVKVSFRGDRKTINITFSNLEIASSVSYSLTYTSRGIKEGAGGTISTQEDPTTRELLFGTCSKGVCRYHTGITGAKFTVTTTLPNGTKVVKPFRLKV